MPEKQAATARISDSDRAGNPFHAYLSHDPARCRECEYADVAAGVGCSLCDGDAFRQVQRKLIAAYGGRISRGLCESGDSLVHRYELFMNGATRSRGSRRVHLLQELASGARHLGCVTFRPQMGPDDDHLHPVADAFLRVPWHMANSPAYTVPLAWYYSAYGGMSPYLCTPYTMHHPNAGYYCAQACVYLCLLMMAPHGGRVFSPTAISALARPRLPARQVVHKHYESQRDFDIAGLNEGHIAKVAGAAGLRAHSLSTGSDEIGRWQACRYLDPYLSYGLPVILFVWQMNLYPDEPAPQSSLEAQETDPRRFDHAVVLIGGSLLWEPPPAPPAATMVIHDTAKQPYVERSLDQVFDSAAKFAGDDDPSIRFTAFCPADVKASVKDVMEAVSFEEWFAPKSKAGMWWRVRLMDTSLLEQHYFRAIKRWMPTSAGAGASPLPGLHRRLASHGKVARVWVVEQYYERARWERREPAAIFIYSAAQMVRRKERLQALLKVGGIDACQCVASGGPGDGGQWLIGDGLVRACP